VSRLGCVACVGVSAPSERFCERFGATVISDEVWEHVVFDGHRHVSVLNVPGLRERSVKIGSAGKIFSLTGWKVGFVVAAPAIIVHDVGRPADRREDAVIGTEVKVPFAVAGRKRESPWHAAQVLLHQTRIETDSFAFHHRADRPEQAARPFIEHTHADLGENLQGLVVQCADVIGTQNLNGRIGAAHPAKWPLWYAATAALGLAASAPATCRHWAACKGRKSRGAKGASRPIWMASAASPSSRAVLWP